MNAKNIIKQNNSHRKSSLSVIIIVQDEADRIEACLKSVYGWADEIVVMDSGSIDDTVKIVKKFTKKVFITDDWPGFGPQKQRALAKATCDWVLSLDADEVVPPELREEIDKTLSPLSDDPSFSGFKIPWAVYIFGKRLDHGRSGRANLRLFKRQGAGFSDCRVHGSVIPADNAVGMLKSRLLHFTYRDFSHATTKFSEYAWQWARQRYHDGKRAGLFKAFWHAGWMFFSIYFLRLGFLDGKRGLLMATLFWQYTFNKYAALWTLEITADSNE